jgi:hypothetical protein
VFESYSRLSCLSAFLLFVLSYVDSGLAIGWLPIQGVLPTVYKIQNFRINSECGQAKQLYPSRKKKTNKKQKKCNIFVDFVFIITTDLTTCPG